MNTLDKLDQRGWHIPIAIMGIVAAFSIMMVCFSKLPHHHVKPACVVEV